MNEVKNNNARKPLIYYYIIALLIMMLLNFLLFPSVLRRQEVQVDYSTFMSDLEDGKISQVEVQDQQIEYLLKDENNDWTVYITGNMGDPELVNRLEEADVTYGKEIEEPMSPLMYLFISVGIPILIFVVVGQLLSRSLQKRMGGANSMMFGKSNAKVYVEAQTGKTFADVAGEDEAKEALKEIVDFLHNPQKYESIGAQMPKGVLLQGPPGTGKTLLAKAVAGEANVPFFSISGSEFVEMFVGAGAARVRDLFNQAQEKAPCIVFIDEIDTIGKKRDGSLGGNDEREQTLNQLLVEMDGFGANTGVIVIAATNRRDILDPALLRPGRFDRQIVVGYPDVKGREEILKVHTKNKPLGPDVDLRVIAQTTVGFTGADLENLVNEAALLAARRGRKAITMVDIEEATIKVVAGPEKKSHIVPDKDKRLTCFHEAGHAVATYYCETQDKVHEISIIPRGMAGGYTMSLPEEDRSYETRKGMQENIVTLLGGRIAEKLVLDDISTGASNDLERATKIARAMVTRYGFSDRLGPIVYGQNENEVFLGRDLGHTRDYSETVAAQIDEEIRSVIDSAYDQCEATLTEHMDQLHKVAEFLYEFEKINGADFDRLMKGDMSVFEEHRAKAGGKTTPMNPVEQPEQIASNDRQLPDDSSAGTAADEAQDGADRPEPAAEPAAKPEANFPSDQSQTDDEQGPAQQ